MLIFYAPPTKEVCIIGSRQEFAELASLIRNGSGRMLSNQTGSPAPYDKLLSAIMLETKPGENVRFTVTNDHLAITGDKSKMAKLADSVQGTAEADDVNGHWHEEYFPGHFYLAPESLPVVFELSLAARNQKYTTLQ